jgi:tRNA dimethylallyltransferase
VSATAPICAIVGPTAAGKAALAREVAARLGREIVVCDSVKVYRGLDIGSAKPLAAERGRVRHHLVDVIDPDAVFSAGRWAQLAAAPAAAGIVVGGTGFYLRALVEPLADAGEAIARGDPVRQAFESSWGEVERRRPGAIHEELARLDPVGAATIHPRNVVRALRALWLTTRHGEPVSEVRARQQRSRPRADLRYVVVDPGPAALRERIARRVDEMFERGWLGEVEGLLRRGYDERHPAMGSLGYKQLLRVLRGSVPLADARAEIVRATTQVARRQRTYFRHQLTGRRLDVAEITPATAGVVTQFFCGAPG